MPENKTMIIAVQMLHGICYAFFFATLYIFIDKAFPNDVRSSAQGLFNLLVLGARRHRWPSGSSPGCSQDSLPRPRMVLHGLIGHSLFFLAHGCSLPCCCGLLLAMLGPRRNSKLQRMRGIELNPPYHALSSIMPETLEQLEADAMLLGDRDRADLAERLVESLASPADNRVQQAWNELAIRRRDEIRSGQVAAIPGPEGLAMVRALVGS